ETDALVEAGVTMCVASDGTFKRRLRFLKRALAQREHSARLAARVAESEERYRTVIEALDEALLVQDADGAITALNPAAARILGLTEDQVRGRPWRSWKITNPDGSIVSPEDVPGVRALRIGAPVRACVLGLHAPGRETIWVSMNSHPV